MRRQTRNYIATACLGLFITSFSSIFWLFVKYYSIRPSQPNLELGFVHPLNNHGSYVYLTDAEATGLSFLFGMALAGFVLFGVIVPKKLTALGFEHDLVNPTRQQYRVLLIAVICYLAIIILLGKHIVEFAVSHGFVFAM